MKQLSVAIPSYNSEKFLEKNLRTYVYEDGTIDPRLEIIIVNDGSTDGTLEIAEKWQRDFPENVVAVDKENGGHGSGINAGIDRASGRYYKVIDSDDWIVTENLKAILDELENTDADAVLTGYHTVNMVSGAVIAYGTGQMPKPDEETAQRLGQEYASLKIFGTLQATMEEMMENVNNIPAVQSFHGIMYNSEFYRSLGIRMSEKLFFEDQEYAILPFAHVNTVLLLPYFFYEYQIGSADQSVNFENQARRADQFLKVVQKMVDYHLAAQPLSEAHDEFMIWRLCNAAVSYYSTVLVKGSDKEGGRLKAETFRNYLLDKEPEVAERCEKKYKMLYKVNSVPFIGKMYNKLFNSKFFGKFKRVWVR